MVAYGFGTSQTVRGMTLDLLLVHKAIKVIQEIKVLKAIKAFQVMMEHLGPLVPKAILVKLARKEIRDYRVPMVLKEIKANPVNLVHKVSKEFQVSRENKAFRVSQDRACPQVEH
jgi:hypothetical protein